MWKITFFVFFLFRPKFAVVIVKKRISARIFHQTSVDALSNPPPGTVVDSVITKKQWYVSN